MTRYDLTPERKKLTLEQREKEYKKFAKEQAEFIEKYKRSCTGSTKAPQDCRFYTHESGGQLHTFSCEECLRAERLLFFASGVLVGAIVSGITILCAYGW